jgi:hypothetical protein
MSEWRDAKNQAALLRLNRALPQIFPAPVLTHALGRRLIPPFPRLAIDSYWRMHPVRADRIARALATKSGAPDGWVWRLGAGKADGLPPTFRAPPAPYRETRFARGRGHCCVCGQPVYRFGWHRDLWNEGLNKQAMWHTACVVAWQLWSAPSHFARPLRRLQRHKCAVTGKRLMRAAEVDHRMPLFQVWHQQRATSWPQLLGYWGMPNLRVINREVHVAKNISEAAWRARGETQLVAAE